MANEESLELIRAHPRTHPSLGESSKCLTLETRFGETASRLIHSPGSGSFNHSFSASKEGGGPSDSNHGLGREIVTQ